jgi:hypothetical protein
MRDFQRDDDAVLMTVLALRYPKRHQRSGALDPTRGRFGREVRGTRGGSAEQDAVTAKLDDIRARIERDAYTVDAAKVADAIVERLLAGRSVKDTGSAR